MLGEQFPWNLIAKNIDCKCYTHRQNIYIKVFQLRTELRIYLCSARVPR